MRLKILFFSSVYFVFFIGTAAACLPAGWFAINHFTVYQNLLWLVSFYYNVIMTIIGSII
ncbi:MAG TPA: hypothetical protein DER05_13450 [Lutibacter sp.]|nr:hypothetical protein [Lutibacter sp.]